MKSHSEKYFTEALQICAFFKYNTNPWEEQISEAIKLMTIDELYANITNTQYETKLMREMIIFLMGKVQQPKFTNDRIGSAIHYLEEGLKKHRKQIIQNYYIQLALSQYFSLTDYEQNTTGYEKVLYFCQLQIQLKFKLLCTLVENVLMYAYPSASKIKKQQLNQTKNSENIGKKSKKILQQILVLGQDNKSVYFFASFQLTYVFTLYMNKWQTHTKNDVKQIIKGIVNEPKSPNMLFLAENLAKIYTNYMEEPKITIPHIRLHKATFSPQNQRKKVKILKQKLLEINSRYNLYLSNFNNRCWGYLPFRENYEKRLKTAQTLTQIVEALKQFFLVSHSKIYVIKATNESKIQKQQYAQLYSPQTRPYCNINTVSTKITPMLYVQSEEISKKMLEQNRTDMFALLQVNVMILGIAVEMLEKKAQKYYQKAKKKQSLHSSKTESNQIRNEEDNNGKKRILRDRPLKNEFSQASSIQDSETNNSMKTLGMNLRQRKKKNKIFGVKMIDSDDSEDQQPASHELNKYEYKTRSVANKQ